MQMIVHRCRTDEDMFRHQTGHDLEVTLPSKDGRDILTKPSLLLNFRMFFIQHPVFRLPVSCSVSAVAAPPILSQVSANQLDYLNPPVSLGPAPPPLHPDGEEVAKVCIGEPTSPLHPTFTSRAAEKVQWWLDREEHIDQKLRTLTGGENRTRFLPFRNLSFFRLRRGRRKQAYSVRPGSNCLKTTCPLPVCLRTLKALEGHEDISSCCFLKLRLRPKPTHKEGSYSCLPFSRHEETPPPPLSYTPPTLDMQEVEVRKNIFYFL